MKIRPVCRVHPEAEVLMLEGTVTCLHRDPPNEDNCIGVRIDEANLYCTGDGGTHDLRFEVEDENAAT